MKLFWVGFEKQAIEPGVKIPIDKPQVVARHVVAKVGKLDALPFAATPSLTLHPSTKDLAGDEFEPFEPLEQFGAD